MIDTEKEGIGIHVGQDFQFPYIRVSIFDSFGNQYSVSLDETSLTFLIGHLQKEGKILRTRRRRLL